MLIQVTGSNLGSGNGSLNAVMNYQCPSLAEAIEMGHSLAILVGNYQMLITEVDTPDQITSHHSFAIVPRIQGWKSSPRRIKVTAK